jgi:adenylosuccinate synthase
MVENVDIVIDVVLGDCAKGKISSCLSMQNQYNFVCRWAGGNNAGHTVCFSGEKYKTNLVPSGVFHGIPSIIGPACVLHPKSFYEEIEYLKSNGFDTSVIKVSPRTHIVTDDHIEYDKKFLASKLGTTSKGIAPAYGDKFLRKGIQAKDVLPKELLWDEKLYGNVLCEGAQGFWLDIDQGDYPYVTSSTTLPYGACSLGFPTQKIRNIYGAAKIYDTKSGVDPLFPKELLDDPTLKQLADVGHEYGTVTGRRRIVNWMRLDRLIHATNMTGTTHVIISKCDVMEIVGEYRLLNGSKELSFDFFGEMLNYISDSIKSSCPLVQQVQYSYSPEKI